MYDLTDYLWLPIVVRVENFYNPLPSPDTIFYIYIIYYLLHVI